VSSVEMFSFAAVPLSISLSRLDCGSDESASAVLPPSLCMINEM
jgi:hypothetical protein